MKNHLLSGGSLLSVMNAVGSAIVVMYSGSIPASADAEESPLSVTTITTTDSELVPFVADSEVAGGLRLMDTGYAQIFDDTAPITHFRIIILGEDDGTSSTTQRRIQGTVGTSGADIILSDTALVLDSWIIVPIFKIQVV
jgi:hypothetical protein